MVPQHKWAAVVVSLSLLATWAHAEDSVGVAYEGHKEQFTIELPQGWTAFDQMKAITGENTRFGMVIFSHLDLAELDLGEKLEAMAGVDTGELPSFFVDRGPAKRGMSCSGFSKKNQKYVAKLMGQDVIFGPDREILQKPEAETISIGDCQGVRVRGRSKEQDGTEWVLDCQAISDGQILYLFSLRNLRENFDKNRAVYESAVASVNLAAR